MCQIFNFLGVWFLLLQPAHADNGNVFCQDAFSIANIKRSASNFIEEVFYPQRVQRRKQILEWGEIQLGRELTDEEANAILVTQPPVLRRPSRDKILARAGFSVSERRKLLRTAPLTEPSEEIQIKVPEKTNEAQELKGKGFNSAYTRGIDEANEWIAVAEQIRAKEADPYITHFDYFARKTLEHIEQFEEGAEDPKQKRKLLRWKKYVKTKQDNGNFTYEDWLRVNWASPPRAARNSIFERKNLEQIDELIGQFPEKIAMPTTTGAVGIMTLNRAGTHGIHTLGLTQNIYYFEHDLNHAINGNKYPPLWLYNNMERLSQGLSIKKRKAFQLAYWLITHENTYSHRWFLSVKDMKLVLSACAFNKVSSDGNLGELKGLMDLSTIEATKLQVEETIQNFTDIFILARRRPLWR